MAKYITTFRFSLRPFVLSSALILSAAPLSAKPKSQCNLLGEKAQCEALKVADISLCQWVEPQTYTINGQRKAYCRMSGRSLTKEQFETLQKARSTASAN